MSEGKLCLKCGGKFAAEHRFNRLCLKCTVSNAKTYQPRKSRAGTARSTKKEPQL